MSGWAHRSSQILEAHAICHVCGWESDAANAGGNGAKHARKYGHSVSTVVTMGTNYFPMTQEAVDHERAVAVLLGGGDPDDD